MNPHFRQQVHLLDILDPHLVEDVCELEGT